MDDNHDVIQKRWFIVSIYAGMRQRFLCCNTLSLTHTEPPITISMLNVALLLYEEKHAWTNANRGHPEVDTNVMEFTFRRKIVFPYYEDF